MEFNNLKRQPPETLWIAQELQFDHHLSCTWNCQPIFEAGEQFRDIEYIRKDVSESALATKDRDLADANHAVLLANNSADAFRRVAEQRQGEIERLQRALNWLKSQAELCYVEVPTEFADIIKPATGASNG